MKKVKIVATHDGGFHADDVFAIAILKLVYPDMKIIRTHDLEEIKKADLRVDVGGRYDPETGDFDHHQVEFKEKRENGVPYSSVGLIWKHFGERLIDSKEAWEALDRKIFQPIDAGDNGIVTFEVTKMRPYCVWDALTVFNSYSPDRLKDLEAFEEAVDLVLKIMKKEIPSAEKIVRSEKVAREILASCDREYVVLDKYVRWEKVVLDYPHIKFVVVSRPNNKEWGAYAVKTDLDYYDNRKDFPEEWGGLRNEELARVTRVEDAIFCHKALFCVVARSKEGAIRLVELALKN